MAKPASEQPPVLVDRLLLRCPAGDEFGEQLVQPAHALHLRPGQLVVPVHQQPQHHQRILLTHLPQAVAVTQRHHHDGVGVVGVGLAALPGRIDPHPRRQLRRHVHHLKLRIHAHLARHGDEQTGVGQTVTQACRKGLGRGGATVEDVALMRRTVGDQIGVKAAGGIRTLADAAAMIKAGANRIGTSSGIDILDALLLAQDSVGLPASLACC